MKKVLLSALLTFSTIALLNAQAIFYVKATATGTGTGSFSNASGDLQAIINSAAPGDSVFVATGVYQPESDTSFAMKEGVKIYGGFAGTESSLRQRNLQATLTAGDTSVLKGNGTRAIGNYFTSSLPMTVASVLDGFTITRGLTVMNFFRTDGGILNLYASPTLSNLIIRGNTAAGRYPGGGGMLNSNSSPTLTNVTVSDNWSFLGGGISNDNSSPSLTSVVFVNNETGERGGGMANSNNSAPTLTNVTFADNSAGHFGAGMYNDNSSPTLTNVSFVNNLADFGAGAGMANLNNSSPKLTNTSFVNNRADNYGGGIYNGTSSSPTVINSVFWGNFAVISGRDISGSATVTYSYTNQFDVAGTGNIQNSTWLTSPPFVDVNNPAGADGIYGTPDDGLQLAAGSQPIDAGTPDTTGLNLPDIDLAGSVRIINNRIDMGAYEYQGGPLPVTLINFAGTLQNSVAKLQWLSGVESNFNHYELQKSGEVSSNNGNDGFVTVATVSAKGSNSHYSYSTSQLEPTAFYRLKLIDDDGQSKYSNVLALSHGNAGNSMALYPNPAKDQIFVKVQADGELNIYDAAGRRVRTAKVKTGVNRIDVSNLKGGLYYVEVGGKKVAFVKE